MPIILVLLLTFVTLPALADGGADEADLHFQIAAERYVAKDFRGALEHFLMSNRLVPNRNVGYNIARTYEQLGRFPDAHRYYYDAIQGETDPKIIEQITGAMQRIAANVAVMDITTTPPGATIYVDRRDLGSRGTSPIFLAFPGGRYKVIASLAGYEDAEVVGVEATLGQIVKVPLTLVRIVGTVDVRAEAGTEVRVDSDSGAATCVAPCTLSLPPGPHTLHFAREGFARTSRQVNVTERETSLVTAELESLTGSVVVSTDEPSALVEIDGRAVGFTPVVVPDIDVGSRKVRVTLRGFAPIERDIVVRANEQTEMTDLRLAPIREVTAASRFSEPIEDAPSSVSIITGQELRAFGYSTIAEALRGTRGMSISHDSLYSSINVRGLGQPNDYGNRLLVLSDGMVLNDNILNSSYVGYDARTDLADIERIEVVRGAGSLLYGTGAVSGVVNLVTRDRDAGSSIYLGAGSFEDAVARVSGGFQLKLDDDAGLWVSVGLARSDGRAITFGAPIGAGTSSTTEGVDAFEAGTTSGRVWWGPLTAQWLYTTRALSTAIGAYGTVFGQPSTQLTDTRTMLELRFEPHVTEEVELLFRAHANAYDFSGNYDYSDSVLSETYTGVWLGAEGRVVVTPLADKRKLRLSLGGTIERHTRAALVGDEIIDSVAEPYLDEDHPFTLGAIYGLIEGTPADWLRVSAGARVDFFSTVGSSFSPRLGLIFKPWSDGVLKVLAGRAFRAPSVYELFYNDGGFTQTASPDLSPETSYSGELEYSHRFFEDWVALAALHTTYLEKIIETRGDATMDDPLVYVNAREPIITIGGDVEVRREWRQGWMIAATYGYQPTRYTSVPEGFIDDRVVNAPEHLASLKAAMPIVPALATLATRLTVEGPRRIDSTSADETDIAYVADVILSGEVSRYHLRYSVGAYNLFDSRYSVPLAEGAPSQVIGQRGRTFLFELTLTI